VKRTFGIALLSLFLFHDGIKSIVLGTFVAHREYISRTLCENRARPEMDCRGKCYLKKQFQKQEERERSVFNFLKDLGNAVFVMSRGFVTAVAPPSLSAERFTGPVLEAHAGFTAKVFQPPRC